MKKRWIALMLALGCLLLAGCRKQADTAGGSDDDVAGEDWRTWGWVDDWGVLEKGDEQIRLLLCVFTENAVLFYDDDTQTEFADLHYPYALEDAEEAYEAVSLFDQNGDGSSDVRLVFLHDDGMQTEFVWCWDGETFVFSQDLSGTWPAGDSAD